MVVVCLSNHLFNLFFCHLRPDIAHDETELVGTDVTVTVLVEHAERLLDLVLHRVRVLNLLRHHVEELREVDRTAACIRFNNIISLQKLKTTSTQGRSSRILIGAADLPRPMGEVWFLGLGEL